MCNHKFCDKCIDRLIYDEKTKCPMCRAKMIVKEKKLTNIQVVFDENGNEIEPKQKFYGVKLNNGR